MTNWEQEYPHIGAYITKETKEKFAFLAFKKNTSMSKLLMSMIQTAVKDIKMEDIADFRSGKNEKNSTS